MIITSIWGFACESYLNAMIVMTLFFSAALSLLTAAEILKKRLITIIRICMNSERFFRLVAKMRSTQKAYYQTKDPALLRQSKQLEKEIDMEISRVMAIIGDKQSPKIDFDTK